MAVLPCLSILKSPENQDFASVWRTPLQHRICGAAPGHQRLHIQQWKYGAAAVKPTLLRAMGLPRSATIMHDQIIPGLSKPTSTLAGRDAQTGQFRTACAKEYPSGLCRALVVTLFSGLAKRTQSEGIVVRNLSQLEERDRKWLDCVAHPPPVFLATFCPTTNQSVASPRTADSVHVSTGHGTLQLQNGKNVHTI